jgi:hypothetical protein
MDESRVHPTEQLVLYVYGELGVPARQAVDQHLVACTECRETVRGLVVARDAAAALPHAVLEDGRFDRLVDAATARRRASARSHRLARWGYIGALAAALIGMVYWLVPGAEPRRVADTTTTLDARARSSLALLAQPASQQRLRGVEAGRAVFGTDERVSAAFVRALRTDPSPNVRLAVVDALDGEVPSRFSAELSAALRDERAPAVRRALVDLVEAIGSDRARATLREVARSDPDASLRARAAAALARLGHGANDAKR